MRRTLLVTSLLLFVGSVDAAERQLRVATFAVDATPPLGSPVAYAPCQGIDDPLSARGVVILGSGKPIVLCAVDFIGIGNGGLDVWREKLAQAAGTTPERVTVNCLHQHDAPRCDFTAEELLAARKLGGKFFDNGFLRKTIEKVASAVKAAIPKAQPVTHLGVGKAKVEKVASNRRVLGPDKKKVVIIRWSRTKDPKAIAAPEGVVDPYVYLLSFWNQDQPVASLTYYATHPQSYYGQGYVTCDFPGIARNLRQKAQPNLLHVHFNGAGGNITAGKYNDGSKRMRPILAQRLAAGMKKAWESQTKSPLQADDVEWRVESVDLPVGEHLQKGKLLEILDDPKQNPTQRLRAASHLAWLQRAKSGKKIIDLSCLRLGDAYVLHMPGELFIEFQLAAQKMRPDDTVCMAAYGDYGPGYIGTKIAYSRGGYETSNRASRVSPEAEKILMDAMKKLLKPESKP